MGCGCQKPKPKPTGGSGSGRSTQEFSLNVDGRQVMTGSRLEADAANVRAGRRGVVSPVK